MGWIVTDDIREGDIIETPSKIPLTSLLFPGLVVPFVKHYAMAVKVDGKLMIVHNTIGNNPSIETFEKVFSGRRIGRVLRTGVTSEEILSRYEECKENPYDFADNNCEDFVSNMAGGIDIGFDQRNGFAILTAIVIVIILVLIFSKSNQ